jgi:hypothetical protein
MRIVAFLKCGVSMAEIARREGVSERGMRKYVRRLIARRAPEQTADFLVVQTSRLTEALCVAYGAMSAENLGAVDRVVKIVRELDRYHGFEGTERRRNPLRSLDSGAETAPPDDLEGFPRDEWRAGAGPGLRAEPDGVANP